MSQHFSNHPGGDPDRVIQPDGVFRADDPHPDNPVEALIRHNIATQNSAQVRFLHHLMLVVMVGFGAWFVYLGVSRAVTDGFGVLSSPMLIVGLFLLVWGPVSHRKVRAQHKRETAAQQFQLDQVKAHRLRQGRDF